jgi:spore cortex formation protein SpoVR/YcgB (stage V sporulation)
MTNVTPMFTGSDWNFELIDKAMIECGIIAKDELHLDTYRNSIEIVTSEQMLDAYTSVGLPVMYKHWSFGKKFSKERDKYQTGRNGLAYELVLNTNPTINYLMEENSAVLQTLVIAHAAYGHNHVFKNNYMFKQWTDADTIIDYLIFARNYIANCEERYGEEEVEFTINAAHALMTHGIDRYKRPRKLSIIEEKLKQKERTDYLEKTVNDLWRTLPKIEASKDKVEIIKPFPTQPEENILYFLEKNSPVLEGWQREILRIVRKLSQYFYPQSQTKVLNEGWACFTHFFIMNRLFDKGLLTEGAMLEFIQSHSNVVFQPEFDDPRFGGLNPYYLGFELFRDIRRICEYPDKEDYELFPEIAGQPWVDICLDAVANYRDESLIRQFLSPKLVRKMKLFGLVDNKREDTYLVSAIQNREGFKEIRSSLANSYELDEWCPKIEITDADIKGDRTLTLTYSKEKSRDIFSSWKSILKHIRYLWGHKVKLITKRGNLIGEVA